MRKWLLLPIRCYQYAISPLMASHCRHYPTCSAYAIDAIETHGAVYGLILAIKRLLRCHPWSEGGYDPVPASSTSNRTPTDGCCQQARSSSHPNQTTH
ncbi:membrane protein insertion efficiency factor YidD [Marinobacter caseinilyticus]|uniref:membrane protein insertion efficiency factor YidD n=1 Tax=Marinobacter caseinilyticus TaxID=2692195 RepID=UPI00140C404B|nr:membrane protein insertion efficiency factor YidD [Marinobacter caseinilyticus]